MAIGTGEWFALWMGRKPGDFGTSRVQKRNLYRDNRHKCYTITMTGRICSICHHTDTQEIEDALISGVVLRAVAERFGLSKSAVARHRKDCLAPKIAAALRVVSPSPSPRAEVVRAKGIVSGEVLPTQDDLLSLSALLGRLAKSLGRLDAEADRAVTEDRPMVLAALSGQLHRGIETTAKLQGLGNERPEAVGARTSIIINIPEARSVPRLINGQSELPDSPTYDDPAAEQPKALILRFGSPTLG
ncbi:hypothetical protein [Emcibacter sp. SYSU 3D8]|uniref:hypothetical protein n=1 Tax=Emcibacter sp. SYSU 3D8 TaxID=3133969 RepID=UPI0031FE75CB